MIKENIIRLLSSLIISIGIIISGYFISCALSPNTTDITDNKVITSTLTGLPNRFHISDDSDKEFLSIFEASTYLSMDQSLFKELVDSGEFSSTYIVLNGQYIFSRSRLDNYLWNLIDSKE